MQTKLVLNQKWGVFFNGNVKMIIRLKASWNAPIFGSDFKKRFFCLQARLQSLKRAEILARLPSGFVYSKVWCFSFHWKKKLFIFDKNWAVWEKMKLDEKLKFSKKKIHFSWNFKNPPKMVEKSAIFSKKN